MYAFPTQATYEEVRRSSGRDFNYWASESLILLKVDWWISTCFAENFKIKEETSEQVG